jgi:hypothetical protein
VGKDHYEDHKEQIELRSGETREVFAKLTKKNTLPPSSTSFNAKSERNALVVDSSPQGALVQINRQYMGETPLRLSNIYPGGHDLRVFKPGYSDYYEHFQHVKGTQKNVFANLTKEDTPPPSSTSSNAKTEGGILVVGSAPTGADVFIDGEYVGRTSLRLSNIKPGSRYVRVAYKGYVDYYENIDISEGSQRVISAWLALAKENTPPPSSTSSNSEQTRTQGSKPSIFVDILKGFAEGINQSNERMDAEQKGLNYDCVRAVNEMVKGGEISRSKGDFLINRDCKKPKERIEPYEGWLVHPSSPTYRARPDGFGGYRIERE